MCGSTCRSMRICRPTTSPATGYGWRDIGGWPRRPHDSEIDAVVEELTDRYGALPETAQRLIAVARLRLLCRAAGITEVSAASAATVRLAPITLPDSAQVRLARRYPGARYRATTATVQVPIPRAGGVGAPRIRDLELVQMVAELVSALDAKPRGESSTAGANSGQTPGEERRAL